MAKINYSDHLDDLLERLMAEDIDGDELQKNLKVAKVVTDIAKVKVDEKKLKIEQFKALSDAGFVPLEIADDLKKQLGFKLIE